VLLVDLFDFLLDAVLFILHGRPLFFKQLPQLLVKVCKSLCLATELGDFIVLLHDDFSQLRSLLICLFQNSLFVFDLVHQIIRMLLPCLEFVLHLKHLILQLAILEHQQFVLSIQFGYAV
jgi:hypothetical protein